ncbi:FHA domain-containing protein FhaB/FipA [Canibacter zhoujuaniae]|uniref:FHA domain-containing protein FhaB/FipA n=1 Tax=Canibacter zhoujuaniae TaxID=2708343 RepID=UPI00142197C4|nr:FHA domain-containing protein [Canibacter zhoujuaniae]
MSELTFIIIRIAFLIVLWLFVFGTIYALRSDLFGAPVRRVRDDSAAAILKAPSLAPAGASAPQPTPQRSATSGGDSASVTQSNSDDELPSAGTTGPARRLVITSGVASGTEITLDEEIVTIGRSADSTLVIVDEYTSTHHAKLERLSNGWRLVDLDSTNGTKVDGTRITGAVDLKTFTPVTIGATSFELRP